MSINWGITNRTWKQRRGELENIVTAVHWICYKAEAAGDDQENWYDIEGITDLNTTAIDSDAFIAYHDITDAQLFAWAEQHGLNKSAIEAEVEEGFSEQYGSI